MPAPIFINMHNQNARTFALVAFGFTYLFFGAAVFHAIEKDQEVADNRTLRHEENQLQMKYNISEKDMKKLEIVLIKLEPYKSSTQWDFPGSLYFAIIVLTTIGYGHSVPQTVSGKIFCMFYALIGVPLYLVMFQAMGERINNAAKYSIKKVGRKLGLKCSEVSLSTLVPFGLFSCALTVTVGTLAFSHFEGWSLLDSGYYCVVTLTTVGFGDYVPLQNEQSKKNGPGYTVFSFIYILLGLTIIGAFINLVVLRLMVTTATGEPPKEEETQVNGVCETIGIAYQANSRCNSYSAETDSESANENGGISLPGMNGNVKYSHSLPHPTRDERHNWHDDPNRFQRRQQSLKTPREEKFKNTNNAKKSRYSDSEFYSLYSELHNDQNASKNCTKVVMPIVTSDNNGGSLKDMDLYTGRAPSGQCIDTICQRRNGLKSFEKRFSAPTNRFESFQAYDRVAGSREECSICQQSCRNCHQLFSLHMLSENPLDSDMPQRNESGTLFPNNNNNGNKSKVTGNDVSSRSSTKATNYTNAKHEISYNNINLLGTSLSPNMQTSSKMFLDPNSSIFHRPRNMSMDSGYEGMVCLTSEDRALEKGEKCNGQISIQDETIVEIPKRSQSLHVGKSHRLPYLDTFGTSPRPSFLSLPFSSEYTTSSSFGEHDFSVCKVINIPMQNSISSEISDSIYLEEENARGKSDIENSKQTINKRMSVDSAYNINNKNAETFDAEEQTRRNEIVFSSQTPAIVVTMCDDNNRASHKNSLKHNNELHGATVGDCRPRETVEHNEVTNDANEDDKNTNIKQDIIDKMCDEHQQQYKLLCQLIKKNSNHSHTFSTINKKDEVNSSLDETDKNFNKNMPTTALCTNGSILTDHHINVLSAMPGSRAKPASHENEVQRSYSCSSADRTCIRTDLFNSLGRRRKYKNQVKDDGFNKTSVHQGKSISSEFLQNEIQDSEKADRPLNESKMSSLVPSTRRRKNKLDMLRIFLSNHKPNGAPPHDLKPY